MIVEAVHECAKEICDVEEMSAQEVENVFQQEIEKDCLKEDSGINGQEDEDNEDNSCAEIKDIDKE